MYAGRGQLQQCYSWFVVQHGPVSVEARVRFVVHRDGKVGRIDACLSVEDPELAECIEQVFRALQLPAPKGGRVRVFYPVSFSL